MIDRLGSVLRKSAVTFFWSFWANITAARHGIVLFLTLRAGLTKLSDSASRDCAVLAAFAGEALGAAQLTASASPVASAFFQRH